MMDRDTLIKDYAAITDRAREESEEIEQILGKALGYPWFKDDPKNFPNATEADGVCVGIETAWSLAMIAADKIKELEEKLLKVTSLKIEVIDNLYCTQSFTTSHITKEGKCSACGISQQDSLTYSEQHQAILL